jgi:hypothetical protein
MSGIILQQDRGLTPPINPQPSPRRHQCSRRKGARAPEGVIYCGRPTVRGNPFRADRFGHAKSVKLYERWLHRTLSQRTLTRLGFNPVEINALIEWRNRLDRELPLLRGRNLSCWCAATTHWCHLRPLIAFVNRDDRA